MIELQKYLCTRIFFVACIQEQYAPKGNTLGLDPFLVLEKGPSPKAAIALDPKGMSVLFLEHLSNEHCLVAQITFGPLHLTDISIYFQHSMTTFYLLQALKHGPPVDRPESGSR